MLPLRLPESSPQTANFSSVNYWQCCWRSLMIPFQHPSPHRYTQNSQQANEAEGSVIRESSFWLISQKLLAAMKPLFWWMAELSLKTQVSACYSKQQELWIDARNLHPYSMWNPSVCFVFSFLFFVEIRKVAKTVVCINNKDAVFHKYNHRTVTQIWGKQWISEDTL